jgi:hypothetical protein
MISKLLLCLTLAVAAGPVFGQSILERKLQKVEQVVAADPKNPKNTAADPETGLPKPKAAVMNVNVRAVATKTEHKGFNEALPNAAAVVTDGEPLWLYLKFNTKLGDYVVTEKPADAPALTRYRLYFEIGPQGDVMTLNQFVAEFTKEDLNLQELKINLAPGLRGRNAAIPIFLANASVRQAGLWKNELRITNNTAFPRGKEENLAKVNLNLDLTKGRAKYSAMADGYDSMAIRGSLDKSVTPFPGTFYDQRVRAALDREIEKAAIKPARVYFAGDGWSESATFSPGVDRVRKVYGVFTYKKGETCFYGTAKVEERFDMMAAAFGEPEVALEKDLPLSCSALN